MSTIIQNEIIRLVAEYIVNHGREPLGIILGPRAYIGLNED